MRRPIGLLAMGLVFACLGGEAAAGGNGQGNGQGNGGGVKRYRKLSAQRIQKILDGPVGETKLRDGRTVFNFVISQSWQPNNPKAGVKTSSTLVRVTTPIEGGKKMELFDRNAIKVGPTELQLSTREGILAGGQIRSFHRSNAVKGTIGNSELQRVTMGSNGLVKVITRAPGRTTEEFYTADGTLQRDPLVTIDK